MFEVISIAQADSGQRRGPVRDGVPPSGQSSTGLFPVFMRCRNAPASLSTPVDGKFLYPGGVPMEKLVSWLWRVRNWTVSVEHQRNWQGPPPPPGRSGFIKYAERFMAKSVEILRPWRTVNSSVQCLCDGAPKISAKFDVLQTDEIQEQDGSITSRRFVHNLYFHFAIKKFVAGDDEADFFRKPQSSDYWPSVFIGNEVPGDRQVFFNNSFTAPNLIAADSRLVVDGVPFAVQYAQTINNTLPGVTGFTKISLSPIYF